MPYSVQALLSADQTSCVLQYTAFLDLSGENQNMNIEDIEIFGQTIASKYSYLHYTFRYNISP